MKKNQLILLTLFALVSFVIAACGGGGDAGSSDSEAASGPETVTLDYSGFDEFRYDPEAVSVSSGSQVTINFTNEGALDHNWLLVSSRVDPEEATEADALSGATTGEILGGESTSITFNAPPPGEYKVVCTVAGHATGGMVADFTVEQ